MACVQEACGRGGEGCSVRLASSWSSDLSMKVSSRRKVSFFTARIARTPDVCIKWTSAQMRPWGGGTEGVGGRGRGRRGGKGVVWRTSRPAGRDGGVDELRVRLVHVEQVDVNVPQLHHVRMAEGRDHPLVGPDNGLQLLHCGGLLQRFAVCPFRLLRESAGQVISYMDETEGGDV